MTKRRIQNRPEEALQKAVAGLLDTALPRDAVWFHPPNGGYRTKTEAGKFKSMGVKPGVPDIFIYWRKRLLCIELKADRGKPTKSQQDMHQALTHNGAKVEVCRSLEEVSLFLAMQIGPEWRASIGGQAA